MSCLKLLCLQVIDPLGAGSYVPEKLPAKAVLVEVKWFWVSIQMDICASEKLYPYKEVSLTFPKTILKEDNMEPL